MTATTSIEWTDRTWNPIRGCSVVSPGCKNCYAMHVAARFSGPGLAYEGLALRSPARWTKKVRLIEKDIDAPMRWRKPQRIFVNSMSDLFHEALTDAQIARVFVVMASARRHTFQVLTKRPERMLDVISALPPLLWPLPNVWLGVSVEDQQRADERIPLLLRTPAAVRFLSVEPLLGPVNLRGTRDPKTRATTGAYLTECLHADAAGGLYSTFGVDWVIVGGESGHGARPCGIEWVESVVKQCREAGVRCFVKQIGSRPFYGYARGPDGEPNEPIDTDEAGHRFVLDRKGGDPTEWPDSIRVREFPAVTA